MPQAIRIIDTFAELDDVSVGDAGASDFLQKDPDTGKWVNHTLVAGDVNNLIAYIAANAPAPDLSGYVLIDGSTPFTGNVGVKSGVPTQSTVEIGDVSGSTWSSSLRFTRVDTPTADIRLAAASDGLLFRNFDSTASKMYSFRDYNDTHIWDLLAGGRSLFNGATDDTTTSVQIGGSASLRTDGSLSSDSGTIFTDGSGNLTAVSFIGMGAGNPYLAYSQDCEAAL
jgi:hypothetical protein